MHWLRKAEEEADLKEVLVGEGPGDLQVDSQWVEVADLVQEEIQVAWEEEGQVILAVLQAPEAPEAILVEWEEAVQEDQGDQEAIQEWGVVVLALVQEWEEVVREAHQVDQEHCSETQIL